MVDKINWLQKNQEKLEKELSAKKKQLIAKQKQIDKLLYDLKEFDKLKRDLQDALNRIQAIKRQLSDKEQQIRKKQSQINRLLKIIQTGTFTRPPYELKWDMKTQFAVHFDVDKRRVRHKMNDGFYQLTSQDPLPKLNVSIINFRLEKYGDDKQIGLGIITQSRKSAQSSFLRKGATMLWTYPRGLTKEKPHPFGKILQDESIIEGDNQQLFMRQRSQGSQGSILQMKVDLINMTMTFINKLNGRGVYHHFPLSSIFKEEEVYVACMMTKRLDCIDVLE